MPRRKGGAPKKRQDPELLAKLRAKRDGMAFSRMHDSAKLRASKATEGTSEKYTEAFEAISKMAPGLVSSSRAKKRLEVILSMIDKHGLTETLQLLKINDGNLKGTLASIFGTSADNPLADSKAPMVDESKLAEAAKIFEMAASAKLGDKEPTKIEASKDEAKEPAILPGDEAKPRRRKIVPYKEMCEEPPLPSDTGKDCVSRPEPEVTPSVAHEPAANDVPEPMGTNDDTSQGRVQEPDEGGPVKDGTVRTTRRRKIERFVAV
jgi:hypothetical protein